MVGTQKFPRVNIVSDDYARYGTSIYQKLYNRGGEGGSSSENGGSVRKVSRDSGSLRGKGISSPGTGTAEDDRLAKTSTLGSSFSVCNGSMVEDTKSLTQQSMETGDGMLDTDSLSKRSKIKRRYKSLISSSSKKFINRLHEHGSSDTFSIFSLRTSHSNKQHELLKSENTIYEKRAIVKYADINDLPVEIVAHVFFMMENDQKGLVNALYVSKQFCEATKIVLYRHPKLTSTYRVGQFVTSLRLHPENGAHVRVLDFSRLQSGLLGKQGINRNKESYENNEEESSSRNSMDMSEVSLDDDKDVNYEVALAGWRDWRHRNDPFYGATFLNSFNLKRVVSRSSSISSQMSSSTASSQAGSSMVHARKHRSNSSVNSFTSSIMSSFQNASHVSLSTTNSTTNGSNTSASGSVTSKHIGTTNRMSNQKSKHQGSVWLKMKLGSKRRNRLKSKTIHEESKPQLVQQRTNNTASIKFDIQPTCKTKHPYTNKFLLKYAPYCDLPLGYILHILKLCPNITELDFSNLILCSDFELISKKKNILPTYSMLPAVQESVMTTTKSEADLEIVYLTDSNKSYDYYINGKNRLSSNDQGNFFKTNSNSSDYPLPIEGQGRRRNFTNHHHYDANFQLRKMNVVEIFDLISRSDRQRLKSIRMNGIVWCRQNMIKDLVMRNFLELKQPLDMKLCFDKAGLNMNLIWTCEGTLCDFVAMMVMDEVYRMDEISLKQVFKEQYDPRFAKDPNIIEVSEVFPITYGLNNEPQVEHTVNFRITILKSRSPTTYRLRKVSPFYHSLVIDLCFQETPIIPSAGNIISRDATNHLATDNSDFNASLSVACKRLDRLTHDIVNRICEVRTSQLRRTIGENNYLIRALT